MSVTLVSMDGEEFKVDREAAKLSKVVEETMGDEDDEEVIPIPNVKGAILAKVVEFLNLHVEIPMTPISRPVRSVKMSDNVNAPYDTFVGEDKDVVLNLILAANYMNIAPLLDLTCAKIASLIKGKTAEEMREVFQIVNDLTVEEEEKIRLENAWAEK